MNTPSRIARLGALALVAAVSSVQADDLSCAKGGAKAEQEYAQAVRLLQSGKLLTQEQDDDVVRRLKDAVANDCRHAALALLDIRALQGTNVGADTPRKLVDARDDEMFALLQAATRLDEGWFEFGNFYLEGDNHYHSPRKAVEMLEHAAAQGDRRAVELLARAYEQGIGGIPLDPARAVTWRHRLEELLR